MPTIEETVKAILDNPIEALSRKHANYKAHRRNTEYLVLKGIISKNSDEYIFTKEELKKFLKNKCRVPQEITENREKNLYGKAWKACSQCKRNGRIFKCNSKTGRAHPGGRCAGGTTGIYNRRKPKGYYACKKK